MNPQGGNSDQSASGGTMRGSSIMSNLEKYSCGRVITSYGYDYLVVAMNSSSDYLVVTLSSSCYFLVVITNSSWGELVVMLSSSCYFLPDPTWLGASQTTCGRVSHGKGRAKV